MIPLTRRRFIEHAAFAAGAALYPTWIRGEEPQANVLHPGVSLADFNAAIVARTASARRRISRAAMFINRDHTELRDQTLAAAEQAMRGRLLLPGNPELSEVGNPPDWLTPRYGDEEYLWSLNRMNHWKTLVRAHALTGDSRYAEKVVRELDDWIARAKAPPFRHADGRPDLDGVINSGPPPWRSLEAGMRMFDAWPVVIEHLAGTAHLPPARLTRIAASVAQHGEALSLLAPLLWPEADHNHYFMEMLGLLSIGVYFPEINEAPRWTDQAVHELQRCVQKQFTADGSHVEAVPSYHNLCVVLLARFLALARAARRELPPHYQAIAAASADHTLHSSRPTGTVVPWGDATQRENHVEAALWAYQATGEIGILPHLARLVGENQFRALSAPLLWNLDDPAGFFREIGRTPKPQPLLRVDRANDQVMLRTSWERDAASVFFSCHSPLLPGSGHQHVDLGGFDFTALGRPLVVDPGVFTYRESEDRRTFKSAAWHSVLTIDGREPFNYIDRWRYTPQKEGRITSVRQTSQRVRMDSFHRNYEPVTCRRTLELIEGKLLVVVDVVENIPESSTVQIYFHLDSLSVTWDAIHRRAVTGDDDVRLLLGASPGLEGELLPGRVSEKFDTERPSTRVRLFDRGGPTRRIYASVLAPFRATDAPSTIDRIAITADGTECTFTSEGREYRVETSAPI